MSMSVTRALKSDGIQCNAAANEKEQVEKLPEVSFWQSSCC
jgi:hypothetical protein